MIIDLLIPILKISDNFDYNQSINQNDYINMLNTNFAESYYDIENYMTDNNHNNIYYNKYRYIKPISNNEDIFDYSKVKANITDMYNNEIYINNLNDYLYNGKMFILIVNIDPETVDETVESELLFWLKDSEKINNSKLLDDNKKLLSLPVKTLKIQTNNKALFLTDCRVLDIYSDINRGQFKFAILIKKIIEQ